MMELPHVLKISVYLCTYDYAEQCSFGGFGRCAGIGVPLSAVGMECRIFSIRHLRCQHRGLTADRLLGGVGE